MLGIDGHGDDTGDGLLQMGSYDGIIFNRFPGQMPCSGWTKNKFDWEKKYLQSNKLLNKNWKKNRLKFSENNHDNSI